MSCTLTYERKDCLQQTSPVTCVSSTRLRGREAGGEGTHSSISPSQLLAGCTFLVALFPSLTIGSSSDSDLRRLIGMPSVRFFGIVAAFFLLLPVISAAPPTIGAKATTKSTTKSSKPVQKAGDDIKWYNFIPDVANINDQPKGPTGHHVTVKPLYFSCGIVSIDEVIAENAMDATKCPGDEARAHRLDDERAVYVVFNGGVGQTGSLSYTVYNVTKLLNGPEKSIYGKEVLLTGPSISITCAFEKHYVHDGKLYVMDKYYDLSTGKIGSTKDVCKKKAMVRDPMKENEVLYVLGEHYDPKQYELVMAENRHFVFATKSPFTKQRSYWYSNTDNWIGPPRIMPGWKNKKGQLLSRLVHVTPGNMPTLAPLFWFTSHNYATKTDNAYGSNEKPIIRCDESIFHRLGPFIAIVVVALVLTFVLIFVFAWLVFRDSPGEGQNPAQGRQRRVPHQVDAEGGGRRLLVRRRRDLRCPAERWTLAGQDPHVSGCSFESKEVTADSDDESVTLDKKTSTGATTLSTTKTKTTKESKKSKKESKKESKKTSKKESKKDSKKASKDESKKESKKTSKATKGSQDPTKEPSDAKKTKQTESKKESKKNTKQSTEVNTGVTMGSADKQSKDMKDTKEISKTLKDY
ncbi:hypothetical protein L596_015899 [Steinernema carpocapsae]|uniref:Uncharacterized protein n=1 Tax=Steinernema carpocapsae TaxID=34508 RepID=A0A4U5NH65_STECR|nr:hypothetical protein L596_015899 [Steinernema carpocapsae]